MEAVLFIVLLCLGLLAVQDFKSRLVSVWLFPVLALGGASWHMMQLGWLSFLIHGASNCLLVLCSCLLLWGYAKKRGLGFLNQSFGLGDFLFLLVFALLFPTPTFLVLWFFGTVLSLGLSILLKQKKVPYAGHLALFNFLSLAADFLFPSVQMYRV